MSDIWTMPVFYGALYSIQAIHGCTKSFQKNKQASSSGLTRRDQQESFGTGRAIFISTAEFEIEKKTTE